MPAIKMYIEKFGKDVLIDEDHPLVAAQLASPAVVESTNYAEMTVAVLTALAAERGVVIPKGSTKKDIVALFEAADLQATK